MMPGCGVPCRYSQRATCACVSTMRREQPQFCNVLSSHNARPIIFLACKSRWRRDAVFRMHAFRNTDCQRARPLREYSTPASSISNDGTIFLSLLHLWAGRLADDDCTSTQAVAGPMMPVVWLLADGDATYVSPYHACNATKYSIKWMGACAPQ